MEKHVFPAIKGAFILDNYIKEILLEYKRTLTLNHKETLNGIYNKVNHVFALLLGLWSITEKRKEAALQELSENICDCSPRLTLSSLAEQYILLLVQGF